MKKVFIVNNTIQLNPKGAYAAFSGRGITFVVLDNLNYHNIFYYVEYKDGERYITHRFTNDEIFGNTFTWTDTKKVPNRTSIRFYIVAGPKTVYTTEYLNIEKPQDPFEKSLLYYGRPASACGILNPQESAGVFGKYDLVILGDGYEDPDHEDYENTKKVCDTLNTSYENTRLVGYIPLGNRSGIDDCYDEGDLEWLVDSWIDLHVAGIFIDEFGYDYGNTRERQNTIVDYCHSKNLFVMVNAWNPDHVFDITTETYEGSIVNEDRIPSHLTYGDYYTFENAFYKSENGSLVMQTPERLDIMYQFWHTPKMYGKTYPEYYHIKTFQLDEMPRNLNGRLSQKLKTMSLIGAALFHNSAVAISYEHWGINGQVVDWDYPELPLYSEVLPDLQRREKVAGGDIFTYAYFSTIYNNIPLEIVFDVASKSSSTYSEDTHYLQYKGRYITDAWTTLYDVEKRVRDLEKGYVDASVKFTTAQW